MYLSSILTKSSPTLIGRIIYNNKWHLKCALSQNVQCPMRYIANEMYLSRCTQICFVCLVGFLTSSSVTRRSSGRVPILTSDNFTCCQSATHERERGYRDLCLSRSHYTDTDPESESNPRPPHQRPRSTLHLDYPRRFISSLSKIVPYCGHPSRTN